MAPRKPNRLPRLRRVAAVLLYLYAPCLLAGACYLLVVAWNAGLPL